MNNLTKRLSRTSLWRFGLALLALMCMGLPSKAEEKTTEFQVIFRVNSSHIEPGLGKNASQVNEAIRFLNEIKNNPEVEIVSVAFCGTASPEGPYEINRELASKRLKEVERLVRDQVDLPDEIVTYDDSYIPWEWLKVQVAASDMAARDQVLDILNQDGSIVSFYGNRTVDSRIPKLMQLNGGATWKELNKRFFKDMRMASAVVVTFREDPQPEPVVVEPVPLPEPEPVVVEPQPEPEPQVEVVETVVEEEIIVEEESDWYRKMYIKTNVPAWALLWQNIGVEVDLAKHWSFALPVYWSPYNYGKQTLKFRTLTLMPEVRYWPKADNMGFFVNAHFGMAYYNYAKDGEYRYQDHDGKTPALGGGIGIGYRFYFCRNHHWTMEAAVGAGVYHLDYDIFENADRTKNGYLLGRRQRTFFGLDQAAFTISYSFGLRKKGGSK